MIPSIAEEFTRTRGSRTILGCFQEGIRITASRVAHRGRWDCREMEEEHFCPRARVPDGLPREMGVDDGLHISWTLLDAFAPCLGCCLSCRFSYCGCFNIRRHARSCVCVRACVRARARAVQNVSWYFEPSQPQRIISGLRETFVKIYILKRTSMADMRPKEQSEKAESCRDNLWI